MPAMADICGAGMVTMPGNTPWTARMCETDDLAVADLAARNLPMGEPVSVVLDPERP